MWLVVLEGEQSLSNKLIVTTPLWQSLVVSPKTRLVLFLMIAGYDRRTFGTIGEEVFHSLVILEELRKLPIDRPAFESIVEPLIHHRGIRLQEG